MRGLTNSIWLFGASFVALSTAPTLAMAQAHSAEVETVIVTAAKRAENIQNVPMSVSAVSGDQLERRGVTSASELVRFIPSIAITQSNNNRNSTILIRGVGTSGTNPGIEASVGIFLDGVYLAAAGPIQVNLQDISAVEVLRGPQGTLYGRNTPVGAINLTTRAPQKAPEAMITANVGNYDDLRLGGYVGGGLSENLSGRLSFWLSDRKGYETNLFDGDDVNGQSQVGARARLLWQPSDDLKVNAIGYYAHIKANCCTPEALNPTGPRGIATPGFLAASAAAGKPFRNLTSGDHVVDDDFEGKDDTDSYGLSVQADKELASGHTLTSITAFNAFDDDIRQLPADTSPLDVIKGFQRLLLGTYSEELRITSPAEQKLSYIAGVYLFRETMRYDTFSVAGTEATRVFPGNLRVRPGEYNHFAYRQATKSAALFGQAAFKISDAWRVTAGGRYSYDHKRAYVASDDSAGVTAPFRSVYPINIVGNVQRQERKFTWSLGSQYDFTPNIMGYVLAATGYKTGGFNARAAAPGTPLEFNPETSTTFEVGVKSTLFDRRLIVNVDAYRMELKDFQDSSLNPLTGTGFIVGNAGTRRVQGVEADFQWRPTTELSINGSGAYMDGEYTDYSAGQCYTGKTANGTKPGSCNFNGLTPALNPEWRWSLAGAWNHDISNSLALFANADVSYTSGQLLEATLDPRGFQEDVTLVGLRLGVERQDGRWRLSAFGKNLTDESYYTSAATHPLATFMSAGGTTAANGFVGWYAPPRTYGAELTVRF